MKCNVMDHTWVTQDGVSSDKYIYLGDILLFGGRQFD